VSAWVAAAIFVGVYVLLATERVHRVAAAIGGAIVVLAGGLVTTEDAFYSVETGIAWDVLALLLGMMIIVGIIKQTGVFEYVAIWSVKRARGRPYQVLVLLLVITAVASAFLDNVTTVVLMAPVTLLVCDRLGLPGAPFLIAEALASNIGGTATLVGDPPNIVIASRAELTFTDFLVNLAPLVVVLLAGMLVAARWQFRDALVGDPARAADVMALDEREAVTDRGLLLRSGIVLGAVLVGFVLHGVLHLEPAVVALTGAGVLAAISRTDPADYLPAVEWETLAFFAGIFVVVGSLVKTGAIGTLASAIADVTGDSMPSALTVVLGMSAVLSAFVDNIPYVAAMSPVVAELSASNPALGGNDGLWWALALGADLGGNATAIGASANIVVIGLARQYGIRISFWGFARYGLPLAAASVLASLPYLLLRYA